MASGPTENVVAAAIMASMNPVISSSGFALGGEGGEEARDEDTVDSTLENLRERGTRVVAFEVGASHEWIEDVVRKGIHGDVIQRGYRHSDTIVLDVATHSSQLRFRRWPPRTSTRFSRVIAQRAANDERDWRARVDGVRYPGASFVLALRKARPRTSR